MTVLDRSERSAASAAPGSRFTLARSVVARLNRVVRAIGGPVTATALLVLALIGAVAVAGPYLLPGYAPRDQNLSAANLGLFAVDANGQRHLFGTGPLGIDTASQLVLGARTSLTIAAGAVLISAVLGVTLGAVGGYLGGWADRIVTAAVDVTLAVPRVLVMIPVVAVFGSSVPLLCVLIGVTGWALFARLVRVQTLTLARRDFVAAAVTMGSRDAGVLWRHILPNIRQTVVVVASLELGGVILVESAMSYLGLGVSPPNTSWGRMIYEAQVYVGTEPRLLLVPGVALALLVLSINLGTRAFTAERGSGRAGGATVPLTRGAWWSGRLPAPVTRQPASGQPGSPPRASGSVGSVGSVGSTGDGRPQRHGEPAESGAQNLLSVRALRVVFPGAQGPVTVVDGVDLDLRPGEILGVVGESGSGKSVALTSLLGLTREDHAIVTGRAELLGQDLVTASDAQLRQLRGWDIGMIFQNPTTALNPVRTVGAQLAAAITAHTPGVPRAQLLARVEEALREVGVPAPKQRMRQYPHEFSGGMQQRVAVAMAMINQPGLIIADEPTTALDVTIQAQVLDLLVQARDRTGAGVIITTHDLGVLAEIADRVVVMYAGRVVEDGSVTEIFDAPAHPYTDVLHRCLPSLERPVARLTTVPGQPSLPAARPSGCAFHPRCPLADRTGCRQVLPSPVLLSDRHHVACHHPLTDERTGS